MFNRVILVGRLTKDPELRYTPNGKAVCSMRLAVDRGLPTAQGTGQEADFINIVAWEKLAETCTNNLQKGRLILVEGRLQIRQYDRDGLRREAAEVIALHIRFLDRPKESPAPERVAEAPAGEEIEDLGDLNLDDLPF
ncbi:MAG: single-stranded DNA-binding protein [Firmicutes bacterium]|nr:single-stranded DNA-binding protein [Bacillota bacterium]